MAAAAAAGIEKVTAEALVTGAISAVMVTGPEPGRRWGTGGSTLGVSARLTTAGGSFER